MADSGEECEETSSCMKCKERSWLAEKLLYSQEELCSMESVH